MPKKSFSWSDAKITYPAIAKRIDFAWFLVLLSAAILIFTIDLGNLPLRDWDEGTVAQVARDIWRAPTGSMRWLYPTIAGEPYHNKPPLMHLLIAWTYSLGGVNEWTTRLPGAILTAFSVPLLYSIGREIFRQRLVCVYSALIYLTMLPVVRHGRLAMLDGAALCFFMLMMLCLLKARRDLRYSLGVGIGFGLICLTKGMLGILLGSIAIIFIFWDTPRLLFSPYMWLAIFIGSVPVISWYGAQIWHYSDIFTNEGLVQQSLSRIWQPVEGNKGQPWYYLLEILKYTFPWLIFFPSSLRFTWANRNLSWAKLIIVWFGVYLITISLMSTKLPWYVFPIYPSIALSCGAFLVYSENLPLLTPYPRSWFATLILIAVIAAGGSIYFAFSLTPEIDLAVIFVTLTITMILTAILMQKGDKQFLIILLWGTYISLILLMTSNHWLWELNERYSVKPVAAMIQRVNPPTKKIYTSFPENRPSLNFYSDRIIIPTAEKGKLQKLLNILQTEKHPYLLLDKPTLQNLPQESINAIGETNNWILVTKNTEQNKI
ncbi:ArnT family glycosyltransferase [Mastigocoleus testarum]|uniref:Glycosyltransferase n=1 Tax=Mastigocoleus testarum BC008 TaxID=371196 RepID=A0A0V7ZQ78_9CYAN|nr:glycosyltransferase family 39 protein [Mastigocoleus testarum]KST66755.1 glycosyltransferase [Mastigocoleus testarum BC008]